MQGTESQGKAKQRSAWHSRTSSIPQEPTRTGSVTLLGYREATKCCALQ